jgi:hypothetical protein
VAVAVSQVLQHPHKEDLVVVVVALALVVVQAHVAAAMEFFTFSTKENKQ